MTNPNLSDKYLKNTYGSSNPNTILTTAGLDKTIVTQVIAKRDSAILEKDNNVAQVQALANLATNIDKFIDPSISNATLAKEYCKSSIKVEICESTFVRTKILTGLDSSSEDYKAVLAARQNSLTNLIPEVVGSGTPTIKLDLATKMKSSN